MADAFISYAHEDEDFVRRLDQALSFFSDAYFLERGYTQDIGFVDTHNLASVAADTTERAALLTA